MQLDTFAKMPNADGQLSNVFEFLVKVQEPWIGEDLAAPSPEEIAQKMHSRGHRFVLLTLCCNVMADSHLVAVVQQALKGRHP